MSTRSAPVEVGGRVRMAAATVPSAAGLASLRGKIGCGLLAARIGGKRALVAGLGLQALITASYLVTREM